MSTPRIRPTLDLPPLEQLLPGFSGMQSAPHRSQALLQQVRQLAQSLRLRTPRRFYSTRDVARFFGVDAELVRRAYGELEREGLLVRMRSSMTLVTPLRRQRRASIRGVVGLPVWHYGYCMMSTWREFHVRLEEALGQRHFVADLIFFDVNAPKAASFSDRILTHDLDYLVWYLPLASDAEILRLLADQGVTPIIVRENLPAFPAAEYVLEYLPALKAGLRDWQQHGIESLDVLEAYGLLPGFEEALRTAAIPWRRLGKAHFPATHEFARHVRGLARDTGRGILAVENLWNSLMAAGDGGTSWLALLQNHRVLIRDRLDVHGQEIQNQAVDLLWSDLPGLAARIADDIASGRLPRRGSPTHWPATYRPRVPAAECGAFY